MARSATPLSIRRHPAARAALWLAGLTAAVLLAVVLAGEAREWRDLKGPLQTLLQHATGMPVELDGDLRAQLLGHPPQLVVQHLRLPSLRFPGLEHLLDATDLRLRWHWSDLWRAAFGGPWRVHSLEVSTLDLQLLRDIDGHTSWELTDAAATLPHFGLLLVRQGRIRLTDAPLATHVDIVLQGAEGGTQAGYTARATGLVRSLPLDLKARVGGALPLLRDASGEPPATPVLLQVDGKAGRSTVHFDGTAAALFDAQQLAGEFSFAGPSLAAVGDPLGLTLPRTPAFKLAGRLAHDAGVWTLAARQAQIGQSRLAGDFRFDTHPATPRLTGALRGTRLLLSDLGPAVGTAGEGSSGGALPARPSGRVLPTRDFDLPSLRAMNADLAVAIDALDFGSDDIAPMHGLRTRLELQDGRLQLHELQADVAGGRMSGTSGLDGTAELARWNADLRFSGIDVASLLPALQRVEGDARSAYLTGELVARVKVAGSGRSTAQILGTLNGQAGARLRNGSLSHLAVEAAGLDVAESLGVMVRGDRPLALSCALVALELQRGVMHTRRAVVDTSDSSLHMDGRIDLNDESLALRVRVKPKDFTFVSLRAPVSVTGTLAKPVVGVEGKSLAGRALVAAALAAITPPAAALAFLDFGEQDAADPCLGAPR